MSEAPEPTITQLLRRWSEGDEAVPEVLLPRVYDELRAIAERSFRREASGHTLQATAVVHEAYLNLTRGAPVEWRDRGHFFGIMARIMRQVLVDHARRRSRLKRGGGMDRAGTVDEVAADGAEPDIAALDDCLTQLARFDPDKARIVELRFFGGLTIEETAACVGVSPSTVVREWRRARAWLYRELAAGPEHGR